MFTIHAQIIEYSQTTWDSLQTPKEYLDDFLEAIKKNAKVFQIVVKDEMNKVVHTWNSLGV